MTTNGPSDLSLMALTIYNALRDGGWHPSEFDGNRTLEERWYAAISQRAALAVAPSTDDRAGNHYGYCTLDPLHDGPCAKDAS